MVCVPHLLAAKATPTTARLPTARLHGVTGAADGLAFDLEGADLCGAERCYCRLPDLTHAASVPPLYSSCHYRISGVIAKKRAA